MEPIYAPHSRILIAEAVLWIEKSANKEKLEKWRHLSKIKFPSPEEIDSIYKLERGKEEEKKKEVEKEVGK